MRPLRILVLGADGYVGWPLSLRLAAENPGATLLLVDNGARRRMVAEAGGDSVTPILSFAERVATLRRRGVAAHAVELDVASPQLAPLVAEVRPDVVYHLAQACSAPWSMASVEQAVRTVQNNEIGNLRLLWALREHAPEAHLVKLGSFGEYAKAGIDIAEGYFVPTWRDQTASRPMPYPRQSDDIYHISKINDSNYLSMACRKWGLAATDIMQSTVFGAHTPDTSGDDALCTRLDYDAVWGTVVNRFLCQAVIGHPLTVYGTGLQRTGLMALTDAVRSLARLAHQPAARGEHRVLNHVTERRWCVAEIAETVATLARQHGHEATIAWGTHNPRAEHDTVKASYDIDAHYVASEVAHTPFAQALAPLFDVVARHAQRIAVDVLPPRVRWAS